mmetsp:Transcript_5233/g.9144  ORF Transcript_5233/g.9144 Transcript_5233/m.9144 type:complete len:87 (+) Transcript_5233:241-501(+)
MPTHARLDENVSAESGCHDSPAIVNPRDNAVPLCDLKLILNGNDTVQHTRCSTGPRSQRERKYRLNPFLDPQVKVNGTQIQYRCFG